MDSKTIALILAMFHKEERLWKIAMLENSGGSAREKLEEVEAAEEDFRKAVGLWAPEGYEEEGGSA